MKRSLLCGNFLSEWNETGKFTHEFPEASKQVIANFMLSLISRTRESPRFGPVAVNVEQG